MAEKAARDAAIHKAAMAKETSCDVNNNDKAIFKTPLRMINGRYPNLKKVDSLVFTPRSAVTPIKRAMEYERQQKAAKRGLPSRPVSKLPRPNLRDPEQHETEPAKPTARDLPNSSAPPLRGAGRLRSSHRGRHSHHPPPWRTSIHEERQREWYVRTPY